MGRPKGSKNQDAQKAKEILAVSSCDKWIKENTKEMAFHIEVAEEIIKLTGLPRIMIPLIAKLHESAIEGTNQANASRDRKILTDMFLKGKLESNGKDDDDFNSGYESKVWNDSGSEAEEVEEAGQDGSARHTEISDEYGGSDSSSE